MPEKSDPSKPEKLVGPKGLNAALVVSKESKEIPKPKSSWDQGKLKPPTPEPPSGSKKDTIAPPPATSALSFASPHRKEWDKPYSVQTSPPEVYDEGVTYNFDP